MIKMPRAWSEAEQLKTLHWVLDSKLIKSKLVAIDGGANVGKWTQVMMHTFSTVYSFEPEPSTFAELQRRIGKERGVILRNEALLDRVTTVRTQLPAKKTTSTSVFVTEDEHGGVKAVSIDSLELKSCGLIKLDLEGAEPAALLGAEKTISRCKPVLIIELGTQSKRFGKTEQQVVDQILGYGYKLVYRQDPDGVFVPC